MGTETDRQNFVGQVRKACRIAKALRDLGVRPHGVVRIDSACGVTDWAQDSDGNQQRIAQTFAEACDVAESFGERLAAEGEICWGGMHSWKKMVDLLERVNRPRTLGFQADMAHTLLYILGYNAPEDALLAEGWDWSDPGALDQALKTLTDALRPWTIDFHVAQNDATIKGSGNHDKTGHHCLPGDPNGKLNIRHHSGFWLRDESGQPSKAFKHICWDGCMFPNAVMNETSTWNNILSAMIAVRDAHGWTEGAEQTPTTEIEEIVEITAEIAPPERRDTVTKSSPKSAKPSPAKAKKTKARAKVRPAPKRKSKTTLKRTPVAGKRTSKSTRPSSKRLPAKTSRKKPAGRRKTAPKVKRSKTPVRKKASKVATRRR
jgi:hypothetical protein